MNGSSRLHLRVTPGAAGARVVGRYGAAWKVRVAAPPENGRANVAVITLLAETVGVPRRDVEIVAGHGARDKTLTFAGISPEEIDRRLSSAAGGESAGRT